MRWIRVLGVMGLGLLLCAVSAQAQTIPAATGWHQLSNTSLQSVCPANGFGGSSYNFSDNCANVILAWNSGAFDTSRNRLLVWGGGHIDYSGNEIYAIDLDDLSSTRLTNPSVPVASSCLEALTGPTGPNSRHTNDGLAYMGGTIDKLLVTSGSLTCGPGNNAVSTWTYSFASGTWTRRGDMPLMGFTANDAEGAYAVWDQVSGLAFMDTRIGLASMDDSTGTWTVRNNQGGHYRCLSQTAIVDPIRRFIYSVGCGQMWRWNIANVASIPAPTSISSTGGGSCVSATGPGLAWDSVKQRVTMWCGGSTVYTLNATTNAWTATALSGTTPGAQTGNGTYKRFAYSQTSQVFVVINAMGSNAFAARLDTQVEDFTVRCAQPGVVKCQGFDTVGDYTNGVKYFVGDGGFNGATQDTTTKVSGTAALRFNLPAGRATSDISGSWRDDMGSTFGEGSTFYAQYRVRISPEMVTNLAQWQSGTDTGWKHIIFHHLGGASCASLELTGTIYQFSGGKATQIFYSECGNRPYFMTGAGAQSSSGPYLQQGTPTPPSTPTLGFRCDFNSLVDGTGSGTGCFNWQWPNEWMTFNWEVRIGTLGVSNSTVKITVARDGASVAWPVVWFNGNMRIDENSPSQRTFGAFQLTPYMTGLNSAASSGANIWFDDLIVSTQPIALPGQTTGGSGGDTTPPSAPTNLRVVSIAQKLVNLAWDASTDDTAVAGYLFEHCNGVSCSSFVQVGGTLPGLSFADSGLLVSTPYTFRVRATDAANNLSSYSSTVGATTPNVAYHPTLNLRRVSNEEHVSIFNTTMKGAP